jgi:hypothetical protein
MAGGVGNDSKNLLSALKKTIKPYRGQVLVESGALTEIEPSEVRLKAEELRQVLEMRKEWGKSFKALMWSIFWFEVALAILVGFGVVEFDDEWFVRIIVTGGFGQLLAMPWLVAKFLFSKDSSV